MATLPTPRPPPAASPTAPPVARPAASAHSPLLPPPQDCVITIPPYFDHVQRAAMINAAAIAGLNVLSLVHENSAFAFK